MSGLTKFHYKPNIRFWDMMYHIVAWGWQERESNGTIKMEMNLPLGSMNTLIKYHGWRDLMMCANLTFCPELPQKERVVRSRELTRFILRGAWMCSWQSNRFWDMLSWFKCCMERHTDKRTVWLTQPSISIKTAAHVLSGGLVILNADTTA